MLVCFEEGCACHNHELLDRMKSKADDEAKLILQKLEIAHELADSSRSILLHYFAKYGNAEMVRYLVDLGWDINAKNSFGYTPLMLVVDGGYVKPAEVLLRMNANIYDTDSTRKSVLQRACHRFFSLTRLLHHESALILEMLVQRVSEDFSTKKHDITHLVLNEKDLVKLGLVTFGSVELASFILANDYDVNYHEPEQNLTALHCAIILGKRENAKILFDHGANVNAVDENGRTPLHYYTWLFESMDEQQEVLLALINRSTSLTKPDKQGIASVERTFTRGKISSVRALLHSGIDFGTKFSNGKSLLHLLVKNENDDILDELEKVNISFDVNARQSNGGTALISAVVRGSLKKVRYLLERGADVNLTKNSVESALYYAVNAYVPVNVCSLYEEDFLAVRMKIASLLLQNRADIQLVLTNHKTLMDHLAYINSPFVEIITAYLAVLAVGDETRLTDYTRKKIQFYWIWETNFDYYKRQLEIIKKFEIYGKVTLFKLLSEGEEKIVAYARNPKFVSIFENVMKRMSHLDRRLVNMLQKRMSNAKKKVKLMQRTASAIKVLTGIQTDVYHDIAFRIINHLDNKSVNNLCQI